MNGIINFLLEQNDPRAEALRKLFVFMLVPMLNPDGVSFGNSRMDTFNQNLNRHYKSPDPKYQPSCFAIKRLV
jgi:cytosolic carboxypeptidase protein 5